MSALQKLNQPLSSKSALRTAGFVFLVIAVAVSGRFAWQKYKARPASVAQTKDAIRAYLEKQAGVSKFNPIQIEQAATNSLAAEASDPASESTDSENSEKKKKKRIRPPHEQLARDFRSSVKEAGDYETIYRLIGENLARVDQLLAGHDQEQTEGALFLAVEASRAALDRAINAGLAARIAEAYLWPNVDEVPASVKDGLDAERLLDISEEAFKAADETDNLIRNYRLLIARKDPPDKADKSRVRLAKLLEDKGNYAEALSVLQAVQDTNRSSFVRRITSIEKKLQQETAN